MHRKLYNSIQSHIILLLLLHAYAGVTSLPTSSTAVKYNDVENVIRTGLASQFTHGFDRLQVLASPWSPSTSIRSTTQTMGGSHSQSPLKHRQVCPAIAIFLTPGCGGLVPGLATPDQAQVHSATTEVATSEQLSSLNIPQATPPPAAAATLTTSNNNAAKPTKLPGNAVSVPAAKPGQRTALDSAVNSDNVAPVRLSQVSTVPQQSTAHSYERSSDIPNATDLVPAPGKSQTVPNSGRPTSPALPAASEDGALLGIPRISKNFLSPTLKHDSAHPSTDQPSMPATLIPTTAPAIDNAHLAAQSIGNGRTLDSSDTAKDSDGILNNGTKSSTAANTTAKATALSRPSPLVSSISIVASRTTVSAGSTAGSQISSSSSASLFFPVDTTVTSPATIPTTAPAILTVLNPVHNAHPTGQDIGNGRRLNSSDTARGSGAIPSINNGTGGQKFSTAANTTANVTAPSPPSLIVSSTSFVAGSTAGSQIASSSSASLFSVNTTATPPATFSSSSNASGLQFEGVGSQSRGFEMTRLLGYLAVCMIVGARILA